MLWLRCPASQPASGASHQAGRTSQTATAGRPLPAGPSGHRSDSLKQIIGENGETPSIVPITLFCNHLAQGRPPIGIQLCLGDAQGWVRFGVGLPNLRI